MSICEMLHPSKLRPLFCVPSCAIGKRHGTTGVMGYGHPSHIRISSKIATIIPYEWGGEHLRESKQWLTMAHIWKLYIHIHIL